MITSSITGNRVTGFYRGVVLKHCENGKCKVMIYGVYPESWASEIEKIPDAEQANSIGFANTPGNGFFTYPAINSVVWCFFANEDQNYPVYFATCQGGESSSEIYSDGSTGTLLSDKNDVNKIVFGGLNITFNNGTECAHNISDLKKESNNKTPSIKISCAYGDKQSYIEIDNTGKITINSCNDINITSKNNINMSANKILNLTAGDQINITSTNHTNIKSENKGINLITNSMLGFVKCLTANTFKWF